MTPENGVLYEQDFLNWEVRPVNFKKKSRGKVQRAGCVFVSVCVYTYGEGVRYPEAGVKSSCEQRCACVHSWRVLDPLEMELLVRHPVRIVSLIE